MCIYRTYNNVLDSNNHEAISKFIDKNCKVDEAEYSCPKLCGGCDYLGYLDSKLYDLEFKQNQGLEKYNICNLKMLEREPDETLNTIKKKIDAVILHFGIELKDISLDCNEQFDEFSISLGNVSNFAIEVLSRASAIENERASDSPDNKIDDSTTQHSIGAYTKLLGDNDFWFRYL